MESTHHTRLVGVHLTKQTLKNIIFILTLLHLLTPLALSGQADPTTYKDLADTNFEVGDKLKVPKIYFYLSGGGGVINECQDSVKVIADFLKDHPKLKIEIGVHTDYRGNEEMNFEISQIRANTVKSLLERTYNVSPDRISAKGYGETKPLITQKEILATSSGDQKEALLQINRRLEVTIIEK